MYARPPSSPAHRRTRRIARAQSGSYLRAPARERPRRTTKPGTDASPAHSSPSSPGNDAALHRRRRRKRAGAAQRKGRDEHRRSRYLSSSNHAHRNPRQRFAPGRPPRTTRPPTRTLVDNAPGRPRRLRRCAAHRRRAATRGRVAREGGDESPAKASSVKRTSSAPASQLRWDFVRHSRQEHTWPR